MGAKNVEQGGVGAAQGVMKDKPLVFVVGGVLMGPRPEKRTAQDMQVVEEYLKKIDQHRS